MRGVSIVAYSDSEVPVHLGFNIKISVIIPTAIALILLIVSLFSTGAYKQLRVLTAGISQCRIIAVRVLSLRQEHGVPGCLVWSSARLQVCPDLNRTDLFLAILNYVKRSLKKVIIAVVPIFLRIAGWFSQDCKHL